MKRTLLLFLFLSSVELLHAQCFKFPYSTRDLFADEVSILQYNNMQSPTVGLKLSVNDIKELDKYEQKLSSINYLEFEFNNEDELKALLQTATRFSNLETIQFNGYPPYAEKSTVPAFKLPDEILKLNKINSIRFYGNSKLKLNEALSTLAKLPQLKQLILIYVPLHEVPKELIYLDNLELLQIGGQLETLPKWFSQMKSLKSLRLQSYKMDYNKAFKILSSLPNLNQLWIDDLQIIGRLTTPLKNKQLAELQLTSGKVENEQDFFDAISASKNLKHLALFNVKLTAISPNISKLKSLEHLKISGQSKIVLSKEVGNLSRLLSLDIESKVEEIPTTIGKLKRLTNLYLNYNSLSFLPDEIGELKNLKYLELSANRFKKLNPNIGKCLSLIELKISANPIECLPSTLGNLTNLKVLEAQHCNLNDVFANIENLKKLTTLDFNDNFIIQLPNAITDLKNLKSLNFSYNQLNELPKNIGDLTLLQDLQLNYNNIKRIPTSIANMQSLKKIGLSSNDLNSIPDQIGLLDSLQELYLNSADIAEKSHDNGRGIYRKDDPNPKRNITRNNITSFPDNLNGWKAIKLLNLNNNTEINTIQLMKAIFSIPSKAYTLELENCGIGELPKSGWQNFFVKSLDLRDNKIAEIPHEIVKAPYLSEINLNRNKLKTSPNNLNQYTANRFEKALWFVDLGMITKDDLPKTDSMVLALLSKGDNHYYRKEFKAAVELTNAAIAINDSLAMSRIFLGNVGESNYQVGNYKTAIDYLTKAIKQDTSGGIRIMNFVIPDFEFRAKSYLKIGDTLNAIKDYQTLAKNFSDSWGDVGILYKNIGKQKDADSAFESGIKKYKEQIDHFRKTKQPTEMHQLSLLELMVIKEDFSRAITYAIELEREFKSIQHKTLLRYLKASAEIGNNTYNLKSKYELLDFIRENKKSISGWGYDLFFKWLSVTKISKEKAKLIREITDHIKP